MRIIHLTDGPYVITDPIPITSYVVAGKQKDVEYGYMASHVVRKATQEEIERWRWIAEEIEP